MKREYISDAIGSISVHHIREAESYGPEETKGGFFRRPFGRAAAAVLILCLLAGGIGVFSPFDGMTVTAYAYGAEEEITAAGAVISTGTISDSGEMTGHPLMFYLSGKDIAAVRYSCKNQQIRFVDWTEQRDEFGSAQNFTVPYGKDEQEYYFLLIDWVPNETIRELTDSQHSTIAALPAELRQDVIVMEITFGSGKTATKAITVSLLDDGTFFASFDDYKITGEDTFVTRPDSAAIPRDVLYKEEVDVSVAFRDRDLGEVLPAALWYNLDEVDNILVQWTGETPVTVRMYYTPMGTGTIEQMELLQVKAPLDGESQIVFSLEESDKTALSGHLEIELDYGHTKLTSGAFNVIYDPNMPEYSDEPEPEDNITLIFDLAEEYYESRGFTVKQLAIDEMTDTISPEMDAVITAQLSKGGEWSEETMELQLRGGMWKVVHVSAGMG